MHAVVFMAASPLERVYGAEWESELQAEGHTKTPYKPVPGGNDQVSVKACGLEGLQRLLVFPGVETAIRQLNLRLLGPGGSKLSWRRSHSPGLMDGTLTAVEGVPVVRTGGTLADLLPTGLTVLSDGELGALQHRSIAQNARSRLAHTLSLMLSYLPASRGRTLEDQSVARAVSTLLMHADTRCLAQYGRTLLGDDATTLAGRSAGPDAPWGLVSRNGRMLSLAVALAIRDHLPIPETPDLNEISPEHQAVLTEMLPQLIALPELELRATPAYRAALSQATWRRPSVLTLDPRELPA